MTTDTNHKPALPVVTVTGANGMLGRDVVTTLTEAGCTVAALGRHECDVTLEADCHAALEVARPDVVIHCAAYTKVDQAEQDRDLATLVNAGGAENMARACKQVGAHMVYVSTDYVFDGTKSTPYLPDDATNPINHYGFGKLKGEQHVMRILSPTQYTIARTSWLYGAHGPNFVRTMLRLAGEKRDLKVINDQVGSPTYTKDLAVALVDIALRRPAGILHTTGSSYCTWFQFAQEIFNLSGIHPASLTPCATADYPTAARRPANSRLCNQNLLDAGLTPLPHWQDALRRYLAETGAVSA